MKTIAILLTVYNRKIKTLSCLNSLNNLQPSDEPQAIDIYMVDDNSTDGTSEAVSERYPDTRIICGSGNLFWNRGMHTAWMEASNEKDYDYYLWINDDTVFFKSSLNVLLSTSSQFDDEKIIVGSTCATSNPAIITYGGRDSRGKLISPQASPLKCDFFNGNIVLIPRFVFLKVGMNDPYFRHALGDFDYGRRAAKFAVQSIIAPNILGECDEHESLSTWCDPDEPFSKRWKAFRSPLGHNPEEFFVYEKRHNGIINACFHYITNHLRVFFPQVWKHRNMQTLNCKAPLS
ncbi:glycosyltransferase family 2 protein [Mangrovibacterium sp.]|uniref:glycosyltransferase family 2 protein n=1 Tax=Mangrovibacterium sp. TaxID=1961364 RepID=UPI003566E148